MKDRKLILILIVIAAILVGCIANRTITVTQSVTKHGDTTTTITTKTLEEYRGKINYQP